MFSPLRLRAIQIRISRKLRRSGLKSKLLAEGKTRWLDVGNGPNFEDGFDYLDWLPLQKTSAAIAGRYYQADIKELTDADVKRVGSFDLVRMQHVFEHFSFEEGRTVLENCARLLRDGGYLLITVPDLRLNAQWYLRDAYDSKSPFGRFASNRIPKRAPASFYFSMFAHSFAHMPGATEIDILRDQHKWCYDYAGLEYQVKRTGAYEEIRQLGLLDPLTCIPFTHNRPEEDVCLLARKRPGSLERPERASPAHKA